MANNCLESLILPLTSYRKLATFVREDEKQKAVRQAMSSRRWQFRGYRLTTAEITYHLPDYPQLLQEFIWQDFDLPPAFPELRRFLDFWHRNLEGRVHSVTVAAIPVIQPPEFRYASALLNLH